MSSMTTPSTPSRSRHVSGVLPPRTVLGIVMAAVGAVVLAAFVIHDLQRYTLAMVSLILLTGFALTREYAFAIVAGITGGLGVGILVLTGTLAVGALDPATAPGWLLMSVGGGFITGWLLGFLAVPPERHPWPLIPGLLIGSIGWAIAAGRVDLIDWIQAIVAVVLVTAGIAALSGRFGHRAAKAESK